MQLSRDENNAQQNDDSHLSSNAQEHSVTSSTKTPVDRTPGLVWLKAHAHNIRIPRSKINRASISLMIMGVLISALVGFVAGRFGADRSNPADFFSPLSPQKQIVTSQSQLINSIAKTVGPSVVSVQATTTTSQNVTGSFFGFGSAPQLEQSAGTGIILSSNGLIITNRHVVPAGTTSVSVTLADGTELKDVSVVGRTSANDSLDIAFLKINNMEGKTLSPAQLGDSTKVQVGDAVVAIGNALGQFQNTITSGIISGHGRSVQASSSDNSQASETLDDLFQTDAAINEGNSGGPLVNMNGQVIGINTAIAGNAQNIGFAIPINDVVGLIRQVESTGKLKQPYLGVLYIPLTDDVAQQYSLNTKRGAWIPPSDVIGQDPIVAGGPADGAGLRSGDVITKVDGITIDQNNSLTSVIDKDEVGQKVDLTVLRDGKSVDVKVSLGAAPADTTN